MNSRIFDEVFKPLCYIYYCKDCGEEFIMYDDNELPMCSECSSINCKLISIEST